MNQRLRPGLAVVRRDERRLQIGVDPPRRVILDDGPQVRRTLAALAVGQPLPEAGADHAVLAALAEAGLLEPETAHAPVPLTVAVDGPAPLVAEATGHLHAAGLAVAAQGDLQLVLGHGAIRRDRVDPLLRSGVWHLLATVTPWGWELGPFVVPGVTACLRCIDAAYAERDPRRIVVLDQVARAAAGAPDDPATRVLALAWLARDLRTYAAGGRPATWSATIRLEDGLPQEHRWLRHPHCGCAWDLLAG